MSKITTNPDGTQVADFRFGFTLDGKAVSLEEQDDGSVYIQGYASDYEVDRQEEAFEPGAFEEGLASYMATNPILLYHHNSGVALGQAVEARVDAKGLFIRARVDAPEPGTIVADHVRKIKSGTLRAFSVGGKFYRRMTEKGMRIFKADVGEISITPYPVNPRTLFAVAGKAFETADEGDTAEIEAALARIAANLDRAEGKASGHEDGYAVAMLLHHHQQVHTMAVGAAATVQDEAVKLAAQAAADSAEKHAAKLHKLAAKIGPLPAYYA